MRRGESILRSVAAPGEILALVYTLDVAIYEPCELECPWRLRKEKGKEEEEDVLLQ